MAISAAVDLVSGAPVPLGDGFARHYGEATQGRTVSSRLTLPKPEPGLAGREWPLRAADFDTAGHANNAIAWAAAEDVLASQDWRPGRAELEYHRPMLPGCHPQLLTSGDERETLLWLMDGGERLATARLAR